MADWEGKSRGNKTGYGIFISVLKALGVVPAYLLLVFVAAYYFLFSWRSSGFVWSYLRQRQGFTCFQSILKLYSNYYWFGQAIIDRIVMMADIKNRFTFTFEGEAHLRAMVENGQGGLLLSAHIGNWEIAGHLLKRLNTKINIVMFDGEHQQLKQYLENTTGQRNANIIVIRDNLSHIYEIIDALNNNELVCMHADRFLEGNKTLTMDFLNAPAKFPQGPFALATKLDVPVSFVFAMKESLSHYHFFATPAVAYKHQPQASPEMVLEKFAAAMTKQVKAYPSQWYNYYDFWK
ncbi:lipid A biosynthesis acyltransferase [Niabella insulamsoli]|uniref:LpxL/LpxP family acyltransferase n=1 Tax=Niabella insulamsoli TaxID=3144874 RepID=UPI0031FCA0FD